MTRTTFDAFEAARGDFAWGYRCDDGVFSRERLEPDGEVGAMGGLATTAADYARYVAFLLGAWPPRDDPETGPVRRSSVREMGLFHAPPFLPDAVDGRPPRPAPTATAWSTPADAERWPPAASSGGLPGYGSHMLLLPERGIGVFAFGNRTYAPMSRLTPAIAERCTPCRPQARAGRAIALAEARGRGGRRRPMPPAASRSPKRCSPRTCCSTCRRRLRNVELAAA